MAYAWIIDKDHLFDPEWEGDHDETGTVGPRDAPAIMINQLRNSDKGYKFRMYDDDGELYYSGRIISDDMNQDCGAPLEDFGMPNAGAVDIRYPGHSEWNCG